MTEPLEESPQTDAGTPVPVEIPPAVVPRHARAIARIRALLEIFLCSGIPTQIFVSELLLALRVHALREGQFNATWVASVTLGDTLLVLLLAVVILRSHGESPRQVFLGSRPPSGEVVLGLLLVVPMLLIVAAVILAVQSTVPSLHNVPENPFGGMLTSRVQAAVFAMVALVGGAVREEVQRAFLLTRFEQHLGGPVVGLIVTSVAFGAGHWLQGWDASLAIGVLGLAWGWIYLRRRSVVAPMVSHAGFNTLEILRFMIGGAASV
jgi:membrane protease YdiL (CAAX protease family)